MRTLDPDHVTERGEALIRRADRLTHLRATLSPYLGEAVALTDEHWATSGANALMLYSDWADGHKARKGSDMLGIPTTTEGAIKDPKADKIFINSMLGGLASRYVRQGDFLSAGIVGINFVATIIRDRNIAADRTFALSHDLDPKAIPINKLKMDFQAIGIQVLTTPYAKQAKVRRAALGVLTLGTCVGIYGQRTFRRKLLAQYAERQRTVPSPS